jgi:hypothetical protein
MPLRMRRQNRTALLGGADVGHLLFRLPEVGHAEESPELEVVVADPRAVDERRVLRSDESSPGLDIIAECGDLIRAPGEDIGEDDHRVALQTRKVPAGDDRVQDMDVHEPPGEIHRCPDV